MAAVDGVTCLFLNLRLRYVTPGNKNDVDDQKQQVRHEDAVRCSKEWGCPYVETSAKLDFHIDTAFKVCFIDTAFKVCFLGGKLALGKT